MTPGCLDDAAQLVAQAQAQLGVEVRERLVEQQELRVVDEAAGERDALHLPARELRHRALGVFRRGRRARAPRRPCGAVSARGTCAMAQRVGDVLAHRHVRPDRIGLEHHADVAQARRHEHAAARAPRPRRRRSRSSPPVGCSRPAMQRSVVVLPQPDGPSSTTISPAAMRKLTSSTAGRPPENACADASDATVRRTCARSRTMQS